MLVIGLARWRIELGLKVADLLCQLLVSLGQSVVDDAHLLHLFNELGFLRVDVALLIVS